MNNFIKELDKYGFRLINHWDDFSGYNTDITDIKKYKNDLGIELALYNDNSIIFTYNFDGGYLIMDEYDFKDFKKAYEKIYDISEVIMDYKRIF